ncbi:CCAAT binding transcription factor component, partial [Ramicandelaber brevisporus]
MAQRTEYMKQFWKSTANEMKLPVKSYRDQLLPMARVKKVMKADSEVKMISGEVPVIFAKACEIFIQELTSLSWMSAEDNKRRTLQRFDVYYATKVSDQYDFLIDIVPPDESY